MSIAIIGAGIAGLACASRLGGADAGVQLFDKARGPGGRMSTRRADVAGMSIGFDHGAQYFTVRDPEFAAQVARWAADGVAARWPAAGADVWVGTPAMNAPVRALASAQRVAWSAQVTSLARTAESWRLAFAEDAPARHFDQLVIALPAEQAAALLHPVAPDLAGLAASVPSDPCWTVMAAFAEPLPLPDTIRDVGDIGWAARNNSKPGRAPLEAWVIQASPAWSRTNLEEDADQVARSLLAMLAGASGAPLPTPLHLAAHRWRYARSGNAARDAIWDAERRLGLCGDWLAGPRVEAAWCSGTRLAERMRERAR